MILSEIVSVVFFPLTAKVTQKSIKSEKAPTYRQAVGNIDEIMF